MTPLISPHRSPIISPQADQQYRGALGSKSYSARRTSVNGGGANVATPTSSSSNAGGGGGGGDRSISGSTGKRSKSKKRREEKELLSSASAGAGAGSRGVEGEGKEEGSDRLHGVGVDQTPGLEVGEGEGKGEGKGGGEGGNGTVRRSLQSQFKGKHILCVSLSCPFYASFPHICPYLPLSVSFPMTHV